MPATDERGPAALGSFLAVGDTGAEWGPIPELLEPQLAVGRAIEQVHAERPADALVLLGDNFYPDGLLLEELVPRVIENVVRPFCAFTAPVPDLRRRLAGDCAPPASPPPIYAVLGNHDIRAPDRGRLQRTALPEFVANWELPTDGEPAVRELPGGLSLIFLYSESPWDAPQQASLVRALREARGPWRILIGHRPPITGHPRFSALVANAARAADRTVHAYVAGHVHVLGAIPGRSEGAPRLTVLAGSGAYAERQDQTEYRIDEPDLIAEAVGFARVASIDGGEIPDGAPRLEVTLYRAPGFPALSFLGPRVLARYTITLDGRVERVARRVTTGEERAPVSRLAAGR